MKFHQLCLHTLASAVLVAGGVFCPYTPGATSGLEVEYAAYQCCGCFSTDGQGNTCVGYNATVRGPTFD